MKSYCLLKSKGYNKFFFIKPNNLAILFKVFVQLICAGTII